MPVNPLDTQAACCPFWNSSINPAAERKSTPFNVYVTHALNGANLQNVSAEPVGRELRPDCLGLAYVAITINCRFGALYQRRAPLLARVRGRRKRLSTILTLVL